MFFVMWLVNGGCIRLIAVIFSTNVAAIAGEHDLLDENRTCIPAEAEPTLNGSLCYPLVNFTRPFCQNHGITLPNYVYQTPDYQTWKNNEFNKFYDGVARLGISKISSFFDVEISALKKCLRLTAVFICRFIFARCDGTQSVFKKQAICRESCLRFFHVCHKPLYFFIQSDTIRFPEKKKLYSGELQPYRNAGDSPECLYLNILANYTDSSSVPGWAKKTDCLYLNGSSYHGNISVTASGIPCQSWTEQCPHRHTMNDTYPELNTAKNHCRNPQNSGQRPWCFTTDRKKRWEYCDIPKCIPVDGNYGNWSLYSTCNVTCGKGFETWTRECNNPEPKYDGRNCSDLGEPVEYRPCSAKPCSIDGGYSNWTLNAPCNVSCGDGVEIWRRFCNNPQPKYGGRNCSGLGNSVEFRNCSRKPCPIEGNYGNWTKSSPCSVTCGEGVEIWTRRCDNPPGKYGGNCSHQGPAQDIRLCEMKPCPGNGEFALLAESSCIPAEKEPVYTKTCRPVIKLNNSFCDHYGFKLDKYVNVSTGMQQYWNDVLWELKKQYEQVFNKAKNVSASPECMKQLYFVGCHFNFPGCDRTTSVFKAKDFCKEPCLHFTSECSTFIEAMKDIYLSGNPGKAYLFSCLNRTLRNAGDSPECVYYEREKNLEKEDCLYLKGSSYHGNISVTASGISCQSWTEQCPHRHTMTTSYPDLNNAKNHCRNPQNSGQRPWCFTTDRKKRWEYCDIPKCIPVHGGYGNWSLNSSCTVTCGKGLETWRRKCNNPEPKYGGRNCSHFGEPVLYKPCSKRPCAVNGNYSVWYLSSHCNVTCGQGKETWRRSCDNPAPKNGGRNCTVLGKAVDHRICRRRPCPVDGNYSNWTKSSDCSVTCGVGYEMWFRQCDNPPPKYGGDCSKYGKDRDSRPCRIEPCPVTSSSAKLIRIACGVSASLIVVAIAFLFVCKRKFKITQPRSNDRISPYAVFAFEQTPENYSPIPIDRSTGERIYEEISENAKETDKMRTDEHIYEHIT